MNRIARILFMPALPALLLFFSLVETPSFAQAPPHQPSQMTLWQARRAMAAALGIPGIRFSPDSFEYDENSKKGPKTVRIDLLTAPAVAAACRSNGCGLGLTYDAGSLPKNKVTSSFLFRSWDDLPPSVCYFCNIPLATHTTDYVRLAESFAAAFNSLRVFARDATAPLRTFTQRAAAWRALATKPPIPEEVRVQRMMAEDAFKANKPDEALHYYEAGVLLYPTWPEGNFNAALIAGDLGYYDAAMEHMQAYLELVPEAADAQAARDKILIWQAKAKEK
jgi:tetratricopeptide (TPR) repeat protein